MDKEEASLARNVAESAELAARLAIERAQAVEIGLDQSSTGPNLERELEQIRDEADHAVQLVQETEQVAGATDQRFSLLLRKRWMMRKDDSETY